MRIRSADTEVRIKNLLKTKMNGRMSALSDTLTIGLVLVLLFGSIALYLYTRIQQAEQKITLLESILLDLKMSSEVKTYSELPASDDTYATSDMSNAAPYKPFAESEEQTYPELGDDDEDDADEHKSEASSRSSVRSPVKDTVAATDDMEFYKSVVDSAVASSVPDVTSQSTGAQVAQASTISRNYEAMTIKELHSLAKQRGITGATVMKKNAIIEALKTSDRASASVEPGSFGTSSSFLETSAFLEQSDVPSGTLILDE